MVKEKLKYVAATSQNAKWESLRPHNRMRQSAAALR